MASVLKIFIYAFLVSLAFLGAGLCINLFHMDNASKEYLQILYFIILLTLALLGNIVLFTKTAGQFRKQGTFVDFLVALLSLVTGLFGLSQIETPHVSLFTIGCVLILAVAVVGLIRTTLLVRRIVA